MKILKTLGYSLLILVGIIMVWFAVSFIDIATKNHPSDSHYLDYAEWNIICIINDYMIMNRS